MSNPLARGSVRPRIASQTLNHGSLCVSSWKVFIMLDTLLNLWGYFFKVDAADEWVALVSDTAWMFRLCGSWSQGKNQIFTTRTTPKFLDMPEERFYLSSRLYTRCWRSTENYLAQWRKKMKKEWGGLRVKVWNRYFWSRCFRLVIVKWTKSTAL